MKQANKLFERRKQRTRTRLKKCSQEGLRLSVFRSSRHIYAQIIDDTKGITLCAASSLDKGVKPKAGGGDKEAAGLVGKTIAARAAATGISKVFFDRGGYSYHGRVRALAEAARENGLVF